MTGHSQMQLIGWCALSRERLTSPTFSLPPLRGLNKMGQWFCGFRSLQNMDLYMHAALLWWQGHFVWFCLMVLF